MGVRFGSLSPRINPSRTKPINCVYSVKSFMNYTIRSGDVKSDRSMKLEVGSEKYEVGSMKYEVRSGKCEI